jgi:hypothetical protein
MHEFWAYPSSYAIVILWGMEGFGFQPTFGAFIVHFILAPAVMLGALWLAHNEGRKQALKK